MSKTAAKPLFEVVGYQGASRNGEPFDGVTALRVEGRVGDVLGDADGVGLGGRAALAAGGSWRRVSGTSEEDVFTRPGAPPTRAETGYGYIRLGAPLDALEGDPHPEPGNAVAGGGIRVTTPCSWSVEIINGTPAPVVVAAACSPLPSAAIWRGDWRLFVQAK